MSIIVDSNTRLLVQGITGHQGVFNTKAMKEQGTKIVAGVTPGKGGQYVEGVPVFNSVEDAMDTTVEKPDTSIIFVPAPYAKDAVFEAITAGIKNIVVITEHVPIHDAMQIMRYASINKTTIIGPNTPGIVSPGKAAVAIMPKSIFRGGDVGVVSRSGTLTYEIVDAISSRGFGESTVIGLGGDRVVGLDFIDVLKLFEEDKATGRIVMVGEIGGDAEERAAEFIPSLSKKVVAYIAGKTAPPGKRMGHAGAIILRGSGTAKSKIKALEGAGVAVAEFPKDIPSLL